ncbi:MULTISPECIES: 50S ribosomal protein L18 [Acidiplasma]|jgi:large subunit ribosomal protein L18|uniref:Large ribosomal subunit protein uL18 n=2 Tax=Acidiplasma TaxID=507753 RepID=A0A0Q0XKC3_9ARCH|nr:MULTISPECIES: 50S ribosomal protein L18 [Acidiplasma]KJE49456.1 50S ribosomal protein L18 [Acidiplasma sp. MBA-1]KPV46387.1 50S ribosomal protein L18 [Acidiplasma aeolicum]KQB35519.1 50S ribosomal protein L18 [Acidiplasma cupricumulans]KQB36730.1 50S ribosomal protein L18 [Acidiplasma aeolicum]WMT54569.1 MAG: 50S ribosomal protein L18 [Acidiplasma sp.]
MKTIPVLKRRKEGITDYYKRYKLLKAGATRAVVRPSNKGFTIQFTDYSPDGDRILLTVTDKTLKKIYNLKGNNIQMYYLGGYLAGKMAKQKDISEAVLDTGRYKFMHGGRFAAALKGMIDAGIDIPADESVFPSEERLNGGHLKNAINLEEYKNKGV